MIAVLFHRLGPYHCARLAAAAARMELVAIEATARDATYAWDLVRDGGSFRRVTLFENLDASPPTPGEVRRRVEAALDDCRPDAVAVPGWAESWALAALRWCLRAGVPAIVMSESTFHDEPRHWLKEAVKRRIVGCFCAGLAGGQPQADYLVQLGVPRARVFTGYDVVDNAFFAAGAAAVRQEPDGEARARLGLPPRFFLASCRFVPKKNLARLLEAFAAYRAVAGPAAWPLVLMGDGPLKPQVLRQRDTLRLDGGALRLPGFVQYGALPAYYALAGAFVHASTSEQWGLVVNEAMACGLPVLVSNRCGCAADLVREGENGHTFDPFSVEQLTAALVKLAGLPTAQRDAMGERSRQVVENAFSPAAFGEGLWAAREAARSALVHRPGWLATALLKMKAGKP